MENSVILAPGEAVTTGDTKALRMITKKLNKDATAKAN